MSALVETDADSAQELQAGGPLEGVRVVVLDGLGPGPFIAMLLADMGADVVRVRRPSHRAGRPLAQTMGLAPERDVVNRGTSSVALDLKSQEGLADLTALVQRADAFIEGFRPGVTDRLGIGPDVLLEHNPALIYVRVTGFGQSGALAQSAGHDLNYVAQSGALYAMARSGERPVAPVNLLGDYAGGGAIGAFGIVCALLSAARTGRGQVVDAAMVDGVALLTAKLQGLRAAGLFSDEPGTNYLDTGAPFYDTYRCADGRHVAVAPLEADFYLELLEGLGVDAADWPDRDDRANWAELRRRLEAAFAAEPMSTWAEVFAGTDACVSPVMTFDEAAQHPHNAERAVFQEIDGVLQPSPAPRFGSTPARNPGVPPRELLDIAEVLADWSRPAHDNDRPTASRH